MVPDQQKAGKADSLPTCKQEQVTCGDEQQLHCGDKEQKATEETALVGFFAHIAERVNDHHEADDFDQQKKPSAEPI